MGDETIAATMEELTIDEVKKEKIMESESQDAVDTVTPIHIKEQPVEEVAESQPNKHKKTNSPDMHSMTPDPTPVGRPMSPTSSIARSEYSVVAASEPPIPRDRRDDDEVIAPSTPRSNLSGGGRSVSSKQSALANRFLAAAASSNNHINTKVSDTAQSTQVKNLASTFGADVAAQQEKQRKLDQLRGGKFKTPSKKWGQVGSVSMKMSRVDEEGDQQKSDKTQDSGEVVSSVSAMRRNWEMGKSNTFNDRSSSIKEQEKKSAAGGFGDLMSRFKVIEGTEKSTSQKTKESRAGISSKAAMFETNVKKPVKGIPKPGVKQTKPAAEEGEPAPNSIRGRAAMFEKK